MRAKYNAFFYFLLTIIAVIIVLKTLNWLPLLLERDTLREYASVEEVRSKLNMKEVLVPSYFPQTITWPPAKILAQAKPYPAVLMLFNRTGKQDPGLMVSQAASRDFPGKLFITLADIKESVPYQLKDRKSTVEVGTCDNEEVCSRLTWMEGEVRITLTMKSPPFELIRIAESMLH